jgi:hypothetical protein
MCMNNCLLSSYCTLDASTIRLFRGYLVDWLINDRFVMSMLSGLHDKVFMLQAVVIVMKDNGQTDIKPNWICCREGEGDLITEMCWWFVVWRIKKLQKDSFEPELNQRPMDHCVWDYSQIGLLLQSTALPTELSKVFIWLKWNWKVNNLTKQSKRKLLATKKTNVMSFNLLDTWCYFTA